MVAVRELLRRLGDVTVSSPADGDALLYDAGAGRWVNGTVTGSGGGGAPSGPAGGVLGGTYPNPSFAADMATQAELDAETAARGAAISALSSVYQPLDSDLTAIAALTTTSFGRALLELADAAAGRTALGLGTAATQSSSAFDAAGSAAAAQAASQPLDSDLTAIAALSTTTFGRSLLALADAAAGRSTLGLGGLATLSSVGSSEITDGSIVNGDISASAAIAYSKLALSGSIVAGDISDAELAALAGLTSAADKLPYFTGSGTAALADLSSTARTLIDDTSTPSMRATLGIPTVVGGVEWTVVTKSGSDTSRQSTTSMTADPDLVATFASGGLYEWEIFAAYVHSASGSGTPNFKVGFGEDNTSRGQGSVLWYLNASAAPTAITVYDCAPSTVAGVGMQADTTIRILTFRGNYRGNGASAGLWWAQNTSAARDVTVKGSGASVLRYRRIG